MDGYDGLSKLERRQVLELLAYAMKEHESLYHTPEEVAQSVNDEFDALDEVPEDIVAGEEEAVDESD